MFHFNPDVDAFKRPIADFRIDQAIFYRVIIVGEARGVLGQGPDVAGLILLNKGGESRRIGGIKDMITRAQELDQLADQGVGSEQGVKEAGGLVFFCSGDGAGGVVSSADSSLPNIRVRTWSLKGDAAFGFP